MRLASLVAVSRAIGYRQTIDYLRREGFQRGDIKAFKEYLGKFKAATRQYAKQQMQWWRRNEDIMFVPVDVRRGMSTAEVDKSLGAAAKIIDRLREVEAEEWKSELADDNGVNKVTRAINLEQGGQMRTFQSRSYFIGTEGTEGRGGVGVEEIVEVCDDWTERIRRLGDVDG